MSIYMDYNATTPLLPELEKKFINLLSVDGNPSSHHYKGREAKEAVELARERVGLLMGKSMGDIVFTGSGTEANNMVLKSILWEQLATNETKHIITSEIEHPCVLETLLWMKEFGVEVTIIPVDSQGIVSRETIESVFQDNTYLISIMMANNETGGLTDIASLVPLAKERGVLFHSDCVQIAGKLPFSVTDLDLDFATVSGHKFHGIKGVGALYVKNEHKLSSMLHGGPQERRLRAGTEPVLPIVMMGMAAEWSMNKGLSQMFDVQKLRNSLWAGIQDISSDVVLNTPLDTALPNTLNVSFPGFSSEGLIMRLDLEGVAVSSGSACSTGSTESSYVLDAMGCGHMDSAIRFSLGVLNTQSDVDYLLGVLVKLLK